MSSTFESTIRQIPYPQTIVYGRLSDLNNLEKIRDKMPQDKIEDFSFDADHIALKAPMVGEIKQNRAPYLSISGFNCCPWTLPIAR